MGKMRLPFIDSDLLVLPHLEYTSTVWDPYHKQDIQALEKVQQKGAPFVKENILTKTA